MEEFSTIPNSCYNKESFNQENSNQPGFCCMKCMMALRQLLACNNCNSKLGDNLICMLMNHLSSMLQPDGIMKNPHHSNYRILNSTPIPTLKKNTISNTSFNSRNEINRKLSPAVKSNTNKNVCVQIPRLQLNQLNVQKSININTSFNNLAHKTIDENDELKYKENKDQQSALCALQDLKIPPIGK